jgi:hypothetical protein
MTLAGGVDWRQCWRRAQKRCGTSWLTRRVQPP